MHLYIFNKLTIYLGNGFLLHDGEGIIGLDKGNDIFYI